jgi:anti-sigma B factor antagonist
MHLRGVLDAHTSPEFEKALDDLLRGGHSRAVLDFQGVDYVSSAGFGVILGAIHGFRLEGADIKIAAMSESIRRIFDMLGFQRVLEVCPTVGAALKRFESPAGVEGLPTWDTTH